MTQLSPFHHHLTMRLAFYIVYSLREWQVHIRECFHTLVSIFRIYDRIHHLLPVHLGTFNVWRKCLSLLGDGLVISTWVSHCCHVVLLLWGSGWLGLRSKLHTVYTYLVELLVMLAVGWTFHWNAAELLSNEFRFVHKGADSTDW